MELSENGFSFFGLTETRHIYGNKIELECRASYKTLLTGVDKFPIPKNKSKTQKNI